MKSALNLFGVAAWVGVAAISVLMADANQPIFGFVVIAAAVFGAWLVGEVITDKLLNQGGV